MADSHSINERGNHIKRAFHKTQAHAFASRYPDACDLMTALDEAGVDSDQDWAEEKTTWTFDDGSRIAVSGTDVEIFDREER